MTQFQRAARRAIRRGSYKNGANARAVAAKIKRNMETIVDAIISSFGLFCIGVAIILLQLAYR